MLADMIDFLLVHAHFFTHWRNLLLCTDITYDYKIHLYEIIDRTQNFLPFKTGHG